MIMFEGKRGKFISIHGIDGTGKTSAAVEVSKKLEEAGMAAVNYDLLKEKSNSLYEEKKKEVDKTGEPVTTLVSYAGCRRYGNQ